MEKTLYEIILKKLGVKVGEKFNVNSKVTNAAHNPYHFENRYLFDRDFGIDNDTFCDLLTGRATIEKLPWKPKNNDAVYTVDADGEIWAFSYNEKNGRNIALLKCDWIFKTRQEAEANRERVLEEMNEVMEQ